MAGIYQYLSDPSGLLVLVRFSHNVHSLVKTTPVYRNDFFEITLSYPQHMRFSVSGHDHNTGESPMLTFISPMEIQQCTAQEYGGEVHMLLISPRLLGITNYTSLYYNKYRLFHPSYENNLPLSPLQFDSIVSKFEKISLQLKTMAEPKALFEEFYEGVSLSLRHSSPESEAKDRKIEIWERFSALLKATPLDQKTIRTISDRLAISYTHLSDTIKEASNFPPSHHLKHFINKLSHTYLLHTKLPANEIANELGFSSHAHFSNFFKELNGVSPSHFRKNRNICKS